MHGKDPVLEGVWMGGDYSLRLLVAQAGSIEKRLAADGSGRALRRCCKACTGFKRYVNLYGQQKRPVHRHLVPP
jgi:hypothetical protein